MDIRQRLLNEGDFYCTFCQESLKGADAADVVPVTAYAHRRHVDREMLARIKPMTMAQERQATEQEEGAAAPDQVVEHVAPTRKVRMSRDDRKAFYKWRKEQKESTEET